jgi:hypothetical protein
LHLTEGKRKKVQHGCAACQRFGDPLKEQEILGACQQELALFCSVGIDVFFDVRQEPRAVLNFVEDDRRGIELEKPPRIIRSGGSNVGEFQRNISMRVLEELLQESRFSGLPWSCENDGGELAASACQNRPKRSGNEPSLHGWPPLMQLCISNANLQENSDPIPK